MTGKLTFSLVSPEAEVFHGEVDQVVVPGAEGEFGVLANHAPVLSIIKPGALRILNDGAVRRVFVSGGFADVTPDGLTVLADEAIDLEGFNDSTLDQQLQDATEDLRDAADDVAREAAKARIARVEGLKAAIAGR